MRFNPKATIDQSQIETRGGGSGGGSGMRMPIPGGGGGRIGLGTVVIVVVFVVISQFTSLGDGSGSGDATTQNTCQSGADADRSDDCAIDLFTNSVQAFWKTAYPQQVEGQYETVKTVRFEGSTASECGQASADTGPFYCPNDQRVYLDARFFKDMLQGQLGAKGGTFAIGYVIAHEYGHHVEDQLGVLGRIRTTQGPKSDSVRVELMADCLAGVWAKDAQETRDSHGRTIIEGLTQEDIRLAIDAAQAVGDDRIQKRSSGSVDSDTFTHGSAAQRVRWFDRGMSQGTIKGCNTFATDTL